MKSNVEQLKTSIEEQKTLNVNLQTQVLINKKTNFICI